MADVAPGTPEAPKQGSGLAIAALVLCIIGLCIFPIGIVGAILGIVALVKLPPGHSAKGMAIAALCITAVSVFTAGILAAIAIPNFIKYQARAKQVECKANLHALYRAEQMFYEDNHRYSADFVELQFEPERGNRYAYLLDSQGAIEDRSPSADSHPKSYGRIGPDTSRHPEIDARRLVSLPAARAGVSGTCPHCNFTATCVGQLHGSQPDVWSISSEERTGPDGQVIAAGQPFNDVKGL